MPFIPFVRFVIVDKFCLKQNSPCHFLLYFVQIAHIHKIRQPYIPISIFRQITQFTIQNTRSPKGTKKPHPFRMRLYNNYLEDSSDSQYLLITCTGYDNTGLLGGCVNNLSVSDI